MNRSAVLLFTYLACVQAFVPLPSLCNVLHQRSSFHNTVTQPQHFANNPHHIQRRIQSFSNDQEQPRTQTEDNQMTHADIEWRLGPAEDTPPWEKVKLKAAANAIRTEILFKGEPLPPILCPKGGKALLEAYKDGKQIGRFGITTSRGPPATQLDETVLEFYEVSPGFAGIGAAAIIYMYVDPSYRKRGVGKLALEVIAAIQTVQGSDFTVLVADDDGSGKLVRWYEECGFRVAPKMQGLFGSTDGEYGVAMIRPTSVRSDIFAACQIKWW